MPATRAGRWLRRLRAGHGAEAEKPQVEEGPSLEEQEAAAEAELARFLEDAPFADEAAYIERLAGFNLVSEGTRDYFLTHLQRYRATLGLLRLDDLETPRILELGGHGLAFTMLIRALYPRAEIAIGEYTGGPGERELRISGNGGEEHRFTAHSFNIESDPWPFPENRFDLVLCMEILEHLLLDPFHAFAEARRVLRPGGRFLVTTPNIASYEALQRVVDLESPYLFGIYSSHGAYGRHNREFTPWEVSGLGEAAGFDTEELLTLDVYPEERDTAALRELFGTRLAPARLRHQNTFYLGRKGEREPAGYPSFLYDMDPLLHRAQIEAELLSETVEPGGSVRVRLRLTNSGGYTWQPQGDGYTRLRAMLLDGDGALRSRDYYAEALAEPVESGACLTLECEIPVPEEPGPWALRFDMVHEQVCWFSEMRSEATDLSLAVGVPT